MGLCWYFVVSTRTSIYSILKRRCLRIIIIYVSFVYVIILRLKRKKKKTLSRGQVAAGMPSIYYYIVPTYIVPLSASTAAVDHVIAAVARLPRRSYNSNSCVCAQYDNFFNDNIFYYSAYLAVVLPPEPLGDKTQSRDEQSTCGGSGFDITI